MPPSRRVVGEIVRLLCIAGFAALHYTVTLAGLFITGGRVMSEFEGHRPSGPVDTQTLLWVQQALMSPMQPIIVALPRDWRLAVLRWDKEIFIVNSLLWGILLYWLVLRVPRAVNQLRTAGAAVVDRE